MSKSTAFDVNFSSLITTGANPAPASEWGISIVTLSMPAAFRQR